jgi:tetratricopeptide (TPR) repeat protein
VLFKISTLGAVGLLFLMAAGGPSFADDAAATDLRFADGLRDLGYFDLAIAQYCRLDWPRQKDTGFGGQIALGISRCHLRAAESSMRIQDAAAQLRLAAELMEALTTARRDDSSLPVLLTHKGDVQLRLGACLTSMLALTKDAQTSRDASAALDSAAVAYKQAADLHRAAVTKIEAMATVTDTERKQRNAELQSEIAARTQFAWVCYRRSEFHQTTGNAAKAKEEVANAQTAFSELSDMHTGLMAGVSATLGKALCLQQAGKHESAVDAFQEVLRAKPTPALLPIQSQAQIGMATSLSTLGEHERALKLLRNLQSLSRRLPRTTVAQIDLALAKVIGTAGDAALAQVAANAKLLADLKPKTDRKSQLRSRELAKINAALTRQARSYYEGAIREARRIGASAGPHALEAQGLIGHWAEVGGITLGANAVDVYARAERLRSEGKPEPALASYRKAIALIGSVPTQQRLARDAWVRMAQISARVGSHYEAGLIFGRIPRIYPESALGQKCAEYSAMLLGSHYEKKPSHVALEAYMEAQQFLARTYPQSQAAQRAAFRLGDLCRGQDQLQRAVIFFRAVSPASEYYERATYLAGLCMYQLSPPHPETGDGAILRDSEAWLKDFIARAENDATGSAETLAERRLWSGEAVLLLARIYRDRQRPQDVLSLLTPERLVVLADPDPAPARRARLLRLDAHAGLGGAHNDEAARELDAIIGDKSIPGETKSEAALIVGRNFMQQAESLAATPDAEPQAVAALHEKARLHLLLSLKLAPDQGVAAYERTARALYTVAAYQPAGQAFGALIDKFNGDEEHADVVRDARRWVARCLRESGDLAAATLAFEALLKDYPRWTDLRKELTLSYEHPDIARHSDAGKQWRRIEETCRMGERGWFEARFHRIRSLTVRDRKSLAYQLLASTAVPYPNLGGAKWRRQFITLLEAEFAPEQQARIRLLIHE